MKVRTSGPRTATAPSTRSWSTRNSSRPRPTCSRSTSSAAGARSTTSSSTTKPVPSPRSRANSASRPAADPMEANPAAFPNSADPRAGMRLPGVGVGLGRGYVVLYLSLIVLIPLAALVDESLSSGLGNFWDQVSSPQAVRSLELTLVASLIVVAINAVFGTIIAWLLVRDEFPGKAAVNAIIDLPFALPTIVASLTLLALYGA